MHLFDVIDGTWPAARVFDEQGVMYRDGQGGGKRVSAASVINTAALDLSRAEAIMRDMGQDPLFMIRDGEDEVDALLDNVGYRIIDPVLVYTLPIEALTDVPIPPVTAFEIWEPLAIMKEIWAQGGIGPARLAVMARAQTKTGVFARWNDKPAGVGFCAVHGNTCMVHAVEVLPAQRRNGVAGWIMRKAAFWASSHGATQMSVLCVRDNMAANQLYEGLGFSPVARYHYRIKEGA